MEAYVAPGVRTDRSDGREAASNSFHLVLLAQNQVGWRNMIQLSTRGHLEGFYYRPRIDRELLSTYSEGIIALSGCPSSELQRALMREDFQEAQRIVEWYREVFDDRYYFEIQRHDALPQFEPLAGTHRQDGSRPGRTAGRDAGRALLRARAIMMRMICCSASAPTQCGRMRSVSASTERISTSPPSSTCWTTSAICRRR